MRSCNSCQFVRDRQVFKQGSDPTVTIRQGWCHRAPPAVINDGRSSAFPGVNLDNDCGEHRYSLGGFFRAIAALFRRN